MKAIAEPEHLPLGISLPPGDPHGVSVHLPKWADTEGWASREPRVLEAMKTGYPRFFVSRVVDRLAMRLLEIYRAQEALTGGNENLEMEDNGQRLAMLLDSVRHAQLCRTALLRWNLAPTETSSYIGVYLVTWDGRITPVDEDDASDQADHHGPVGQEDIVLVSYPAELATEAKAFWQHTGFGISSRRATHWLEHAPFLCTTPNRIPGLDHLTRMVKAAREMLKRRIATGYSAPSSNLHVSPSDVFLFPTGMTAIIETADAIKGLRPPTPSSPRVAVFGFPYVDTYKLLSSVLSYTPTLYKYCATDLAAFETALQTTQFAALFTEFPGNPLLQSPDLARLSFLSKKYNFVLVVDDTVGTSASLSLLRECDVVCTSLTKMFSGGCNVMGGSVVLNSQGRFYGGLKGVLGRRRRETEAAWFGGDVLVMEGNSGDFGERVKRASGNAEGVVGVLRGKGGTGGVVREVYYPKGAPTQEVYERYRVEGGGYGFLVSVRFWEKAQAVAFYDALDVAKGPSLGTNFTLCCAYTLLAHYKELEWAAEYGVVEDLVRISVGLEEWEWLEERVGRALREAEAVDVEARGRGEGGSEQGRVCAKGPNEGQPRDRVASLDSAIGLVEQEKNG